MMVTLSDTHCVLHNIKVKAAEHHEVVLTKGHSTNLPSLMRTLPASLQEATCW
jgi:hypothetical protein